MLEVKSSVGKHEADIPSLSLDNALTDFFANRREVIDKLASMQDANTHTGADDKDAILPKLENAMDVASLHELTKETVDLIFALEKKFVLFGKLSTHYSSDFRPLNEKTNCPDVYVRLAAVLLRYFFEADDLNALNSAIRLLDNASIHIHKLAPCENIAHIIHVFELEERALREFSYD